MYLTFSRHSSVFGLFLSGLPQWLSSLHLTLSSASSAFPPTNFRSSSNDSTSINLFLLFLEASCLSVPTSASFYPNIDCVFSCTSPNHFSVALLTLSPRHLTCTGCPSVVWISDPTHPLPHRWVKPRIYSIWFFRVGWRWKKKKKKMLNPPVKHQLLRLPSAAVAALFKDSH